MSASRNLSNEIEAVAHQDAGCERLMSVPGVGPIISSAMVAAIGTGDGFSKGRDELCRVMGLSGEPDNIDGGEVEKYFREGRIQDIADYCESDVVNTYRVWLRYELFRGKLSDIAFQASEANLSEFIRVRSNVKPHLGGVI